jgi:hypothetical protein
MQRLQENIKEVCESSGNATFYNHYSGRGMYNRTCVGIVGDSLRDCQRVIAEVIKDAAGRVSRVARESKDPDYSTTDENLEESMDAFDTDVDRLMNTSMDSMGQGVILYWVELDPLVDER